MSLIVGNTAALHHALVPWRDVRGVRAAVRRGVRVRASWEGRGLPPRLRVTEDEASYGVMLEAPGVPAEAFAVTMDDHHVYVARLSAHPSLALTFDAALDANACSGECADGLLRLTLGKQERAAA